MASTDILSQTLATITSIKLEELSGQQASFEDAKAKLLKGVEDEPSQSAKLHILLDGIEDLPAMKVLDSSSSISLENARRFLAQSRYDASVSDALLQSWQLKLEAELHANSSRFEYASLYGRLVNEWLSVSQQTNSTESSSFEQVGRKEMHEQRKTWENYVFHASQTDTGAIERYLQELFTSEKHLEDALKGLRGRMKSFEKTLKTKQHFDNESLKTTIQGLLRSDLISDQKRATLKDFLNNSVVLDEVADVLNMRISSLDKWQWDPKGTPVEQRRQLNGRYRFYHDEDLLQTILLRYIGVTWSVELKNSLTKFFQTYQVMKPSAKAVPLADKERREFFLGSNSTVEASSSVNNNRASFFNRKILLEQLQDTAQEVRGGYDDNSDDGSDGRSSPQETTQSLLHTLATEIILQTRLGKDLTVVRSDFAWFGPSLPHSTMFSVLKFFGISDGWIDLFRRVLEAPMKFVQDGSDAPVQIRKRGTPISGPLSDFLGEAVLFTLDFAFNQKTNGATLFRLHDDLWFWGNEETCIVGWKVMNEFTQLMGLEFNKEKTGSVKVTRNGSKAPSVSTALPKGDVRWGFLKLDAVTGRFLIDQTKVDEHIEELRRQLSGCKSVFDWIQAWSVYGSRFFTTNFGKPANCYGLAHVEMILETFSRIQKQLFSKTGGSVATTLQNMLTERFGITDIPEAYLYFPMSMGGLDLKSPFVNMMIAQGNIRKNPDEIMDAYFAKEQVAYQTAKYHYEAGTVPRQNSHRYKGKKNEAFMSLEEFTRHRERYSPDLVAAYRELLAEPLPTDITQTADIKSKMGTSADYPGWPAMSLYERWITQLYGPHMIDRFGGLSFVQKGLLPTGMVNMFRESRFKWQG